MKRICQNCGAPIPQGAKFCVRCGKTVESPAASPVDAKNGKPSSAKRVVLLAALGLVIAAGGCFGVKTLLELHDEKAAAEPEPAYTDTAPNAAAALAGNESKQLSESDTELPVSEEITTSESGGTQSSNSTVQEDSSLYRPENILQIDPDQLNWTPVIGEYDLYFEVPEGFEETPIGIAASGNTYVYYSEPLDVLIRVWESTRDAVYNPDSDRLFYSYSVVVDESSMNESENTRVYTCTEHGKPAVICETWGDAYAYYFMFEYPDCTSEQADAYFTLMNAFLARMACNNMLTEAASDYILPQSAERRLTEEDLSGLTHEELCLARNEIYARHGRRFNNQNIAAYFEAQSWYAPSVDAASFDANQKNYLSEDELYNVSFLLSYEKQKFGKSFY